MEAGGGVLGKLWYNRDRLFRVRFFAFFDIQLETPVMNRRLIIICAKASISLVLSGCAQSTLTNEESKQYASLTLPEFLSLRFKDNRSVWAKHTVRYTAIFNDVNYRQLDRPTIEIIRFCKSGSGDITRIKPYSGMPVGQFFSTMNPPANPRTQQLANMVPRWVNDLGPEEAVRYLLTQSIRENTENKNSGHGIGGAWKAYDKVRNEVTYGKFQYVYQRSPERNWNVDITPVAFLRGSPEGNLLENPKLIIEIAPGQ